MTKENREKLYSHYKDLAENYEAPTHLNAGPTATSAVRKNAKAHVKEMLARHPELEPKKEEAQEEPKEPADKKKKNSKKKAKVK